MDGQILRGKIRIRSIGLANVSNSEEKGFSPNREG
jgi:hypothetical protein